jgi:hypothetical protein
MKRTRLIHLLFLVYFACHSMQSNAVLRDLEGSTLDGSDKLTIWSQ